MVSRVLLNSRQVFLLSLAILLTFNVCLVEGQRSLVAKLLDKKKQPGGKSRSVKVMAEASGESSSSYGSVLSCQISGAAFIFLCSILVVRELSKDDNEETSEHGNNESLSLKDHCDIEFEDIHLTLHRKTSDKVLLDGSMKGKISSGRMLAIMGPSGAGKTTACLAIAGRIPYSDKISLEGSRYVNGHRLAGDSELPAAFVKQEDNFFPHMTVRETLNFRVELKNGGIMKKEERDKLVNELLEKLSLSKVADTIVGDIKVRGVSGGERKRLSIACEMINSPPVIILDEPTSGLDSYQAFQVVSTLKKLANEGKTIIAVIHQPSQQVFSMFDDLLLISEGRQMYFGEVKNVRRYFNNLGYPSDSEIGTAEYVIDLISASEFDDSASRLDNIAENAKAMASKMVIKKDNKVLTKRKMRELGLSKNHRCVCNIFTQFKLLFSRSIRETFRGKGTIIIKAVQQITTALIYGGIYTLGNNQASIRDRIGLISLIAIGTTNLSMASTIRSFPREKGIVTGEISSNLYNTFPYFIAKAISEIPLVAGLSALFGSILYPLVGLQKERFSTFLGLSSLHSICSQSAGLLVGSISPNSDVSLALFPPIIVLNIIFDGKNISTESIPKIIRWLPKLGLIRWGYEGMVVNELKGLTFVSDGPFRGPVAKTGEEALARYGLEGASIERTVRSQLNIIAASWLLSFLGLSATKQKYVVMKPPKK